MQVFLPSTKFYVCSRCHTHIVTEHNFIQTVYRNGLFTGDCIFQHLTNVNYLDLLNEDRVQRVHCKHCDLALGFKYVRVPAAQLCVLVQNETRSKLNLERLSYWNGHQVVSGCAAVLPEPIPGPEPVFQLVPEPNLPAPDIDQLQAIIGNHLIVPHPHQVVSGHAAVLPEPIPGPAVFQFLPEPNLPAGDIDELQAIFGNHLIVPQPQPPDPP